MTFLDRMFGYEARDATLREPPDWLWDAFGSTSTYTGKRVGVDTALELVSVFAAVRIIAETIGTIPLVVYKQQNGARQQAPQNRWWRILHDAPNPEQPAGEVWETIAGHLLLWGNAYLYKAKDSQGRVVELWPIRPSRVRVGRVGGKRLYEIVQSTPGIDINPLNSAVGDESDILHIRAFGTDGLVGLSPIGQARQALGIEMAAEEYQGRFYGNNAQPGGVLTHPGVLSPQAAARLRAEWQTLHGGLANAAKAAVLQEGMTWQQTGLSFADQQFIQQRDFSVAEIARLYRIPPYMLNAVSHGSLTYSTTELEAMHFVTYTLMPWTRKIEQALMADSDTATMGAYPEFLMDGLLRADSQGRAQFYTAALDPAKGWMTRDEVRERENLPPLPDTTLPPGQSQPTTSPSPEAISPSTMPKDQVPLPVNGKVPAGTVPGIQTPGGP